MPAEPPWPPFPMGLVNAPIFMTEAQERALADHLRAQSNHAGNQVGCVRCERGDHHLCTGYDGPITTHPDSLPLCGCDHGRSEQ